MMGTKTKLAAKLTLLASLSFLASLPAFARGKDLTWKPVAAAVLKLDNHPVKNWDILQPDKNRNLVLVQVEKRWFVFQLKEKRIYSVERSQFRADGENLVGPPPGPGTPLVKTDGWDSHDVGPAQQITVRLADTSEVLTIELPHPLSIY